MFGSPKRTPRMLNEQRKQLALQNKPGRGGKSPLMMAADRGAATAQTLLGGS